MMFDGVNLVAVAAAGIASFIFGSLWYAALGKAWMKAADLDEARARPDPVTLGIAFFCQLIMAFVLAGVIYHAGGTGLRAGIISALMIWIGIVMTTQIINHRFQGKPWSLTLIDGGHWLGVLLMQGIVIGSL